MFQMSMATHREMPDARVNIMYTRLVVGNVQALVFAANCLSFCDERRSQSTAVANG